MLCKRLRAQPSTSLHWRLLLQASSQMPLSLASLPWQSRGQPPAKLAKHCLRQLATHDGCQCSAPVAWDTAAWSQMTSAWQRSCQPPGLSTGFCVTVAHTIVGAEITIAYTELAATRQERRDALVHQYHFDIDPKWPVRA